jgi:hypothetical protein
MKVLSYPRSLSLLCLLAVSVLLNGCASNFSVPDTVLSSTPAGDGSGDLHGNVYGGRQPITGASVYLYGAPTCATSNGNGGYGSCTGISLLGNVSSSLSPDGKCDSSVIAPLYYDGTNCYYKTTTGNGTGENPGGEFFLTGLYNCTVNAAPTPTEVWLFSIGGNPGVTGGVQGINPYAGLSAALGTCPSSGNFSTAGNGALSYIYMNEVSTMAFGYAVAGFAEDARTVSAPPNTYATNLVNAFYNAAKLYDIQGGADPGDHGARHKTPNGAGATPYLLINSLANDLATCVNSQTTGNPNNQNSTACDTLFQASYQLGPDYPANADTATAAILIAQRPQLGSTASLTSSSPENIWTPNYTSVNVTAPYDYTAAISYANINNAFGVAIDTAGNAYITENAASGAVAKIAPSPSTPIATSPTLYGPSGITVDSSGNIWTPGQAATGNTGPLYMLSSSLGLMQTYNLGSSNQALQITADATANVYLADTGKSQVLAVTQSGGTTTLVGNRSCTASVTGIAFSGPAGNFPSSLWVTGAGTGNANNVCEISKSSGTAQIRQQITGGVQSIAIDSIGQAWSSTGSNLYYITNTSSPTLKETVGGGSLSSGGQIAVDGLDNIWILNYSGNDGSTSNISNGTAPSIAEYSNIYGTFLSQGKSTKKNATAATGYQYGSLSYPTSIAIDGTGDVWITNNHGQFGSSVTELVGAAAPMRTPLYLGGGQPQVKTDAELDQ